MSYLFNYLFSQPRDLPGETWGIFINQLNMLEWEVFVAAMILTVALFLSFVWAFKVNSHEAVFIMNIPWWLSWLVISILQGIFNMALVPQIFGRITEWDLKAIYIPLGFWSFLVMPILILICYWAITLLFIHPPKVKYAIPLRNKLF